MKHNLQISVSNKPEKDGIVSCRTVSLKERLLKKLFGTTRRVTIIVPGDSVEGITILEGTTEGGEANAT